MTKINDAENRYFCKNRAEEFQKAREAQKAKVPYSVKCAILRM